MGEVRLVFCTDIASGETWGFSSSVKGRGLALDVERREIVLKGRTLALSGKTYQLFHLLWENRGRTVTEATIKKEIWPERQKDNDGMPLVNTGEIDALVHRLRDQLGEDGLMIRTIRGYGYLLDEHLS